MLRQIVAFADRHVLLAMGITVFGSAAFFSSITYIAPMMLDLAGYSAGAIVWLMVLFGVGLFGAVRRIDAEAVPGLLPDPASAWVGAVAPRVARDDYTAAVEAVI